MSKTVTLAEVIDSKVFVSPKSEAINFKHPMDYIQPVIDRLGTFNPEFKFQAQVDSLSKDRDRELDGVEVEGTKNISYSRMIVKAKMPSQFDTKLDLPTAFDHLPHEIGFVYSLDTANPELRAYSGKRVQVCQNGCIWGASSITSINLLRSNHGVIYDSIDRYAEEVEKSIKAYQERAYRLFDEKLSGQNLLAKIGKIHWHAKMQPKLGINFANEALASVQNSKTIYALDENLSTNAWTLYNACTEALKKSNILDESAKILLLDKIFQHDN